MNDIINPNDPVSVQASESDLEIGQWYWVKETCAYDRDGMKKGDVYEWLGCVMVIGSNYVELAHPQKPGYGSSQKRVHFNEFWDTLRREPNAEQIIRNNVETYQKKTQQLLGEIQALTARLGVAPTTAVTDQSMATGGQGALAVLSSQIDVNVYKQELIKAKETTLPDLFKQVENANNNLAKWMSAGALPLQAKIGPMKGALERINDSIFNVSLYAGLTEDAVQCADGEPAGMGDKLHIMQRRLYMDEECLLNYSAGGMEFKQISQFDAWLAKPENRDRLLPFPRTVTAFRVRRKEKERSVARIIDAFINFELAKADELTFIYIRNGDQVWRIDTDFDFGSKLFPDAGAADLSSELVIKLFGSRIDKLIPRREYESLKEEYETAKAKAEAWTAENPDKHWMHAPYVPSFDHDKYEPFDPSSVYFDDASAEVAKQIKAYNRVGLIIQGLFDRSPVLHPHPPVQMWTQHGFERAVELVYDGSGSALYDGEKPDFQAYRDRLNATLGEGSVVTGQRRYWGEECARRENERVAKDYRYGDRHRDFGEYWEPYGNPGPGLIETIKVWQPRARKAVFHWTMKTESWNSNSPTKPRSIAVPVERLFNVSAYKPGDYKQFFRDPRTRQEYLQWAPLMLAAEDYYANLSKER